MSLSFSPPAGATPALPGRLLGLSPPEEWGQGWRWTIDLSTGEGLALREQLLCRLHRHFGLPDPREVLRKQNRTFRVIPFRFMATQPVALRRSDLELFARAQRHPAPTCASGEPRWPGAADGTAIKSPEMLWDEASRQHKTAASEQSAESVLRTATSAPCSHYVTWKSDGRRYLLLFARIRQNGTVHSVQAMIGRGSTDDVFLVSLPSHPSVYDGSLLDGELMRDNRTFEAFDIVACSGNDTVRNWTYRDRQTVLGHLVPVFASRGGGELAAADSAPTFAVRLKQVVPLTALRHFAWDNGLVHLDNFQLSSRDRPGQAAAAADAAPPLTREVDGLVIYTNLSPVKTYADHTLKKFKPLQSVDFQLAVVRCILCRAQQSSGREPGASCCEVQLLAADGTGRKVWAQQNVGLTLAPFRREFKFQRWRVHTGSIVDLEGRIVECALCPDDLVWKPLVDPVRRDKTTPNSIAVVQDTQEAMADNVTLEELCRSVEG